jgi:putative peptide zinc metalloprotease protein
VTPSTRVASAPPRTSPTTCASSPAKRVDGGAAAVPTHAEGVQLFGEMEGSGYRHPPALVRRADGQTITLTPLLYLTLKAIDGRRGYEGIAAVLTAVTQRLVTADDVVYLVEKKLRPLGLLRGEDGAEPQTSKVNPLLALRLKFVVSNPRLTRRVTAPFAWLFHPGVALPLIAMFAVMSWWILFDKGLGSATHQVFYEPEMVLAVWALVVLSAGFHEFGHAAACRYGGATPGVMGAGLYLVWPAFYTEVTDSYRLGRGGRLRVDLGGLYFNAIFALATLAAWAVLRWDALLVVVAAQHLQMVRQLAPFIRADGYHIVADLTGVPDLFSHIKPTLLGVVPRRWRPSDTAAPALKRWARMVVVGWVLLVVPVLIGLVGLAVVMLPRLAATAWDSMGNQWAAADAYWLDGDLAGVFVRLFSAAVVALPVLALLYLLVRIGRRGVKSAWSATRSKPYGRAGVLLLGAGSLAGLVWAWWPADQYRPIEQDESGTLPQLVSQEVEDRRVFLPLLYRAAPTVLVDLDLPVPTFLDVQAPARPVGDPMVHRTIDPAPIVGGTAHEDAAEQDLAGQDDGTTQVPPDDVTQPGTDAGTAPSDDATQPGTDADVWPFPFNRPPALDPGDNRAEAVNTTDGSVRTDLAVAWAIVTANEVSQSNEAYALASCRDCTTMAVAFQVLLLVGDPVVITPVNAAVAVNYQCDTCLTEAIAVQLVLSVTDIPSAEARRAIAGVMAKVRALEVDLASLSSGQVYYLLQESQAEIMRVLTDDGVLPERTMASGKTGGNGAAPPGGTAIEPSEPGTDGTDKAVTDGSATTPSGGDATIPKTEPTSEPSAEPPSEPSAEPSGEQGEEPISEPTNEPTSEPTNEPTTEPTSEPASEPTTGPTTDHSAGTSADTSADTTTSP